MPLLIDYNTITIRNASQVDRESIRTIHTRAVREISGNYYTPKEIRHWLESLGPDIYGNTSGTDEFIVAEHRESVIGFGLIDCASSLIVGIYVSPDYVRRGIGTMILRELERVAARRGVMTLQLCASLNALPFYENAGYGHHILMKHRLPGGVELTCVYMTKKLFADN